MATKKPVHFRRGRQRPETGDGPRGIDRGGAAAARGVPIRAWLFVLFALVWIMIIVPAA